MGRIAFYLDTRNIRTLDVRDVDAGNPGMGGTEYMFFLIAAKLARTHDVPMYVTALGAYPEGIRYCEVKALAQIASELDTEDILILRESEVLTNLHQLKAMKSKVVVWAHNYSGHRTLKACVQCPSIVRYLCVSREQYENLRDEDIFAKADYIFNAIVTRNWPKPLAPSSEDNVFYMGSLIEAKGFHVLAQQWPKIAQAVPTAHLHVVGTGQLYDRNAPLGPLGIASPDYERRFTPFLTEDCTLRKDVTFHGNIGADKLGLLSRAKVAVANPTGIGETFCITALEFGLLGVPVVTKKVGGPVNVVENGVSGLLYDHEDELADAVIALLSDEHLCRTMGHAASERMRALFDIEVVIAKWERVLREVQEGVPASPDYLITGTGKRLKECNRKLRAFRFLRWLPSIDYWRHAWNKKKHSLFNKRLSKFTHA